MGELVVLRRKAEHQPAGNRGHGIVQDQPAEVTPSNDPVYYGFPPTEWGSYRVGLEKLGSGSLLFDLSRLYKKHWAETEVAYRGGAPEPNWSAFISSEDRGEFLAFTARNGVELVGYLGVYCFRSMHNVREVEAREDAWFITAEHRGRAGLARHMLEFAEEVTKFLGACRFYLTSKAPAGGPDIDKFLRRQGFKPMAVAYTKDLGD